MDELGTRLAELVDEAAAGVRPPGATAARRRGRRRRRRTACGGMLLVVSMVAGLVGLDRWVGAGAGFGPAGPELERTPAEWRPFEPPDDAFRPTGPAVLVTEGETSGDRWRLYGYQATERGSGRRAVCLHEQVPGGGGGGTCQPADATLTAGASGIGDPKRLIVGQVTKKASKVRLLVAAFGKAVAPVDAEPLPGQGLPVNFYAVALPKTVEVEWVVALDATGRELGRHEGWPADYNLEPPGPVTELGQIPSPVGLLRVQVYEAELGITCMRVIPVHDPGGGLQECLPPLPVQRPSVEAFALCYREGVGLVFGTAPRDASSVRLESADAAAVEADALDGGERFGRRYWVLSAARRATGLRVLALADDRTVVASAEPNHTQPLCGPP